MNEVTRVHIAKTPYEIEVAAKKDLEKYLHELKKYINDDDVYSDIEIRVTEILQARGTDAGGVIDSSDVASIRKQLGEPHEFDTGDSDIDDVSDVSRRILYRDLDGALLGGVLSGIAKYLRVDATWVRLGFIVLLFASFGVATLLYLVLWLIVPPAVTASDKLRLEGKVVDARSIRELGESAVDKIGHKIPVLSRILGTMIGIGSVLVAIGIFVAFVGVIISVIFGVNRVNPAAWLSDAYGFDSPVSWMVLATIVFGVIMLMLMWAQIGYVFITRKFTRKTAFSLIGIITAGIIAVAIVAGVTFVQSSYNNQEVQKLTREYKSVLPQEFSAVNGIVIGDKDSDATVDITYVASPDKSSYITRGLAGTRLDVSIKDGVAYIETFLPTPSDRYNITPSITIYGPALKSIDNNGVYLDYEGPKTDGELSVTNGSDVAVSYIVGGYDKLSVQGSGLMDVSGSSVRSLTVDAKNNFSVQAGTVNVLDIHQAGVCPSETDVDMNYIHVDGVNSGEYTYNDAKLPVENKVTNCGKVVFGNDDDSDDY